MRTWIPLLGLVSCHPNNSSENGDAAWNKAIKKAERKKRLAEVGISSAKVRRTAKGRTKARRSQKMEPDAIAKQMKKEQDTKRLRRKRNTAYQRLRSTRSFLVQWRMQSSVGTREIGLRSERMWMAASIRQTTSSSSAN